VSRTRTEFEIPNFQAVTEDMQIVVKDWNRLTSDIIVGYAVVSHQEINKILFHRIHFNGQIEACIWYINPLCLCLFLYLYLSHTNTRQVKESLDDDADIVVGHDGKKSTVISLKISGDSQEMARALSLSGVYTGSLHTTEFSDSYY